MIREGETCPVSGTQRISIHLQYKGVRWLLQVRREVVSEEKRRGERGTWRKNTQAREKESTAILKPAFPQPWLESHPCTDFPAKAASAPAGLSALPEGKLAPPSLSWSRGVRVSGKQGRALGSLLVPMTREKGPKMVVVPVM